MQGRQFPGVSLIENFRIETGRMPKRVVTPVDCARQLPQNLWLPHDVFA